MNGPSAADGYLLGADVGSSGCKVVVADLCGKELGSGQASYSTRHPRPGWAEQDPADWYVSLCAAVRASLAIAGVPGHSILGLSVTGPAHTVALLDKQDQVLRPAIHWSDLRSVRQAEWLEAQHGERVFELSYQPVNPSWTASQLLWVRDNEPVVWGKLARILPQKDYLVYTLTGAWQTDTYDAIGTQLFDCEVGAWSQELCNLLDLDPRVLPPVREAVSLAGRLSTAAAQATGLPAGTAVAVGSGDSAIEALGVGALRPGQGIVKLATSGAVNVVTAAPQPHRTTMTYKHLSPGCWYTIAATSSGAASWAWFQRAFGREQAHADPGEFESLAEQAPTGSEGLLFHPYLQGERAPYWDACLRGGFLGITPRHRAAHFARAVLEGVAYSLRDCLAMLEGLGLAVDEIHLTGGGARRALWRQITADVLGRSLRCPEGEATALGAALVAGVAVQAYDTVEQASRASLKGNMLTPDAQAADRYSKLFLVYQQAAHGLAPVYHSLAAAVET
jgi:xylulokinase